MSDKEQAISALRIILQKVEEAEEAKLMNVGRVLKVIESDVFPDIGQTRRSPAAGRETITITVRINGGGDDGL